MKLIQKQSWLRKTWWKYTDHERYIAYKRSQQDALEQQKISQFARRNKELAIMPIIRSMADLRELNVVHSGNAGDIIYSLPVVKFLFLETGLPINFLLKLDQKIAQVPGFDHPLGNVMLNRQMAENLVPLLRQQSYISSVSHYEDQVVQLDLSQFRESGIDLNKGNIARWNFYTTGINANLCEPWLDILPEQGFSNSIMVSRSQRYRNHLIDYSFLSAYKNMVFLGLKQEFDLMKKKINNLEWYPVKDFLEMARVIKGCKFFVGNQSLPFAIAEGLKVPRILEIYPKMPNVIPDGPMGYDFYFQSHFEYLVANLSSGYRPE